MPSPTRIWTANIVDKMDVDWQPTRNPVQSGPVRSGGGIAILDSVRSGLACGETQGPADPAQQGAPMITLDFDSATNTQFLHKGAPNFHHWVWQQKNRSSWLLMWTQWQNEKLCPTISRNSIFHVTSFLLQLLELMRNSKQDLYKIVRGRCQRCGFQVTAAIITHAVTTTHKDQDANFCTRAAAKVSKGRNDFKNYSYSERQAGLHLIS